MQWALLGVIVIGLFFISGRYPRIAFSALGAIVFGVAALILLTEDDTQLGGGSVAVDDIEIGNFAVLPAYADSYKVTGRVFNRDSDAELRGFTLNVVMEDCAAADAAECLIVGQASERVVLTVPGGQARDFSSNVYFGRPNVQGVVRWQFSVAAPRG